MFTDIKGFTSLMESDEEIAVELVKTQREIIRKHVAIHQGEERETIGDAFLVIFDSAVNAVSCAIEIQKELFDFNKRRAKDKQVWVRIGIHSGDILIEDGSVFGESVNLAARVEPLAKPGGVCITRQIYDQVKYQLPIKVDKLGVWELKNITNAPDIFRIRLTTTAPEESKSLKNRLKWFAETKFRLAASIMIGIIVIAADSYWTFFAPHVFYATQIEEIYHEPNTLGRISKAKADKLNHYFKITQKGLHPVRLEEITKPWETPSSKDDLWKPGFLKKPKRDYPIHEYIYDSEGLSEEHVLDRFGVLQYKLFYDETGRVATIHDRLGFVKTFENQISGFGYDFDSKGHTIKKDNRNAFGTVKEDEQGVTSYRYTYTEDGRLASTGSFNSYGNPVEDKKGVAVLSYTYDDNGLLKTVSSFDRYGEPKESTDGVALVLSEYDKLGRLVLEKYEDRFKTPVVDNEGSCAKKFSYDSKGELIQIENHSCEGKLKATKNGYAITQFVYANGHVTLERYLDEKKSPTTNNDGISEIMAKYDKHGRVDEISYFDINGKPTVGPERTHAIQYSYNEYGQPVRRLFKGIDENPLISANGYAEIRIRYDEHGNAIEWAYFDTSGEMVNSRDGYAIVENEFDQSGNNISKTFFDKNNAPATGRENACHRIEMKYDERGELSAKHCLDGHGNLTAGIKNCAISRYAYNGHGKLTRSECYISEKELIDEPDIPSILDVKYDKRGYVNEVRAYDANGNLAERFEGAAIWRRLTDEHGNELEVSSYDRNEHLINNPKYNAAIFRREYDERGHEVLSRIFDEDGKPTKGIFGFAEIHYAYDDHGNNAEVSYFNEDGVPALNAEGVHKHKYNYDSDGRLIQTQNLGVDDAPVLDVNQVAYTNFYYDTWGHVTKKEYLDTNKALTLNKENFCAYQTFNIDDKGNVKEIDCFDPDSTPCRQKECIARTLQDFDSRGRMTKQIFKTHSGEPDKDKTGAFGYQNDFDIENRLSVKRILGPDGKNGADNDGVHEYRLNYGPVSGKLFYMTFLDKNDSATRTKNGSELRLIFYDPIYSERKRAIVDANFAGKALNIKCLDDSGNVTQSKSCVSAEEVRSEVGKIKSSQSRQAIPQ